MESVIFRFIDKQGNECISIGNMSYLNKVRKNCIELVSVLKRKHTEEDREYLINLSQDELLFALEGAIKNNPLHVLYLN